MVPPTKATISTARSTGGAVSRGQTRAPTQVISLKIISKERVFTTGATAVSTQETGKTTKWRDVASSSGPTVASTRVSTSTIRKKARASFSGLMVENMRACGSTESKMVSASTLLPTAKPNKENGKKESVSLGLRKPDITLDVFCCIVISFINHKFKFNCV